MSKKTALILKLIGYASLLLLFVALGLGIFRFQSLPFFPFQSGSSISIPGDAIASVKHEAQTFDDVEVLVMQCTDVPIHIEEADVETLTVVDTTNQSDFSGEKVGTYYVQNGTTLTFYQKVDWGIMVHTSGSITVQIPYGKVLEYRLLTVSGDITLDAPSRGTLEIQTVSSDVEVTQSGDSFDWNSVSGDMATTAPFQSGSAETVSGDLLLTLNGESDHVSTTTVSGDTVLQVDESVGGTVSYRSVGGDQNGHSALSPSGNLRYSGDSVSGDLHIYMVE